MVEVFGGAGTSLSLTLILGVLPSNTPALASICFLCSFNYSICFSVNSSSQRLDR